jgi:hypothetical protein
VKLHHWNFKRKLIPQERFQMLQRIREFVAKQLPHASLEEAAEYKKKGVDDIATDRPHILNI